MLEDFLKQLAKEVFAENFLYLIFFIVAFIGSVIYTPLGATAAFAGIIFTGKKLLYLNKKYKILSNQRFKGVLNE